MASSEYKAYGADDMKLPAPNHFLGVQGNPLLDSELFYVR